MSLCQVKPQGLQQIGGFENLAIVPDIVSLVGELQGCKRYRTSSDLSFEEELELLSGEPQQQQQQQQFDSFSYPDSKRPCGYNLSPSPVEQFQLVESCSITPPPPDTFTKEVKDSYNFGGGCKDSSSISIFTCGENSPVTSSPVAAATDFSSCTSGTTQAPRDYRVLQLQDFAGASQPVMQCQPQAVMIAHHQPSDSYEIVITEQPEEYYRARYNSEGVRAPLKGMVENYPTVQVYGPEYRYGRVDVKLVHEDGTPHTSCSLDTSEGRKNAVSKKIGPFNHMVAEFEDLRIRRVKKEGRKKSTTVEKAAPKDGRSDKVASLLFTATLETEQGEVECSIQSKPISLTTAPEPAELDWLEPNRGHFAGQEPLVIKGSKMTSPKVTFRILLPDGRRQELHGSVDKERSHQNVLLVKTPSLTQMSYQFAHQTIRAEVVVITGRNQMSSNALQFDFIPNHICRECMQETPRPPHMTTYSPSALPSYLTPSGAPSTQSPPPTPGLPPPPPPPPPTQSQSQALPPSSPSGTRLQQTPSQIHLGAGSQQSSSSYTSHSLQGAAEATPIATSPSTPGTLIAPEIVSCPVAATAVLATPHQEAGQAVAHPQGKSGDEIMYIMKLMEQDCGSGATLGMHGKEYLYAAPQTYARLEAHVQPSPQQQQQQQQQQATSPYIPVTSPSAASDQPCYSPVTPVQSPNSAPWNYIEQMLTTLFRNEHISRQDYRILTEECSKQNPNLLQAFNTSQSNEAVFLQLLLATFNKADQTFQATH